MDMDLSKAMLISASGMRAQGQRMRVISENVANANSLPMSPDEAPYRRKLVTFKTQLDRAMGVETVRVGRILPDRSDFGQRFDPSHPGADELGTVRTPNVKTLVEMSDMRESQRSYEANMNIITSAKRMLMRTIELLR